ncbi:MAG: hypothetical protein D6806_13135 [Deltaproteobacteria bacterium]|nr:MAG: hypothetical protein D6806_13135 [Deltaproteobacteria bacterium]
MKMSNRTFATFFAACVFVAGWGCGGQEKDESPPRVESTEPADGAVGVDPSVSPAIIFNEAIDRDSLRQDMFHLVVGGQARFGNVSYDLEKFRATLTLLAPLEAGVQVEAVLEPGVRDLAGNRQADRYSWHFTVAE